MNAGVDFLAQDLLGALDGQRGHLLAQGLSGLDHLLLGFLAGRGDDLGGLVVGPGLGFFDQGLGTALGIGQTGGRFVARLAELGLDAHGFREDADRLTSAWLFMQVSNAIDHDGTIPEKFDVVARTHAVFSEYDNAGTDFDYIATEGFGWMNASFEIGLSRLSPDERRRLNQSLAAR